jgi:lysyl-tRNA synthetase class I
MDISRLKSYLATELIKANVIKEDKLQQQLFELIQEGIPALESVYVPLQAVYLIIQTLNAEELYNAGLIEDNWAEVLDEYDNYQAMLELQRERETIEDRFPEQPRDPERGIY